jgi:cysteinyl-tRNA synthetase
MDDDFNTALALAHVFELVRAANRLITEVPALNEVQKRLLISVREKISEVGQVLGLFYSTPAEYLERIKGRKVAGMSIAPEEIEQLLAERAAARKSKDFRRSDEIRDSLLAQGIELLDGPQGTIWKVK